jgi:hypothetical protein
VKDQEIAKLETYFRRKFQMPAIKIKKRPRIEDSVEFYIGEEFIGVITRDDEDDDLSYNFSMCVLEMDLEEGA